MDGNIRIIVIDIAGNFVIGYFFNVYCGHARVEDC